MNKLIANFELTSEQIIKFKEKTNISARSIFDIYKKLPSTWKSKPKRISEDYLLFKSLHLETYFEHLITYCKIKSLSQNVDQYFESFYVINTNHKDYFDIIVYLKKQLEKTENFHSDFGLDKNFFNQIFTKNMDINKVEHYIDLLALNCIDKLNKIDSNFIVPYFAKNKRYLNMAIDMYCIHKDDEYIQFFISTLPIVKLDNPELSGIKYKKLLNYIQTDNYTGNRKEEIENLLSISSQKKLIKALDNNFSIEINLNNINILRKDMGYQQHGSDYVMYLHTIFSQAKNINLEYFNNFIDKTEMISTLSYNLSELRKKNNILADIMKNFDFLYTNQNDSEKITSILDNFINETVNYPINSDSSLFLKTLSSIILNEKLHNSLALNDVNKKQYKI